MLKAFANIAFLFLLNMYCHNVYAQDSVGVSKYGNQYKSFRKTEILAGISWQGNWKDKDMNSTLRFAEIGVAKSLHEGSRHGPVSVGVYVSEEICFGSGYFVLGNKLGAYMHGMLADFGLAVIYYTDFKRGNFKIRPELGIGLGAFRIAAGINIPTIDNKAFELVSRQNAQLSIQFFIPVKKKEYSRDKENIFKEILKKS